MAQGPKHEAVKLQGPELKRLNLARQGSLSKPWRRRHQGPTYRGNKSAIDREASGSERGPNRAKTGLVRSGLFWARFAPPLTYVLLYIFPLPPPTATSIHSSESHRHEGEAPGGSRRPLQVLELPRRWLGHALTPWLALLGEAMVEFRSPCLDSIKATVHSTFDGDINHVFFLLWSTLMSVLFICISSIWF
jgi:hypothetical protein